MNTKEDREAENVLAELTRMAGAPLLWVVVYSLSFVCGSTIDVLQKWDYSMQDCLMATGFAALTGIVSASKLEAKYWMGFSHFAAMAYLLAWVCAIPVLQAPLASVQVIFFMSSVLLASASYALHRRFERESLAS